MTKRPTDGIRRLCGIVEGIRDNEFAETTVRKAAVAEECDRLDEAVGAVWHDMWDEGFEAGREWSIEDREAAEWVRDHGGLDAIKKLLDWVIGHCSTRQQLDFDFWLSGRVMHELGFDEDMADRDEVGRRLLARLMPDGMEWPRFEDGEPVRIGDKFECWCGEEHVVGSVSFRGSCAVLNMSHAHSFVVGHGPETVHGERVKRPAPKVLDADGEETRVGDKLYDNETGCGRTVRAINANGTIEFDGYVDRGWLAKFFTHRAPVLAADGRPLREGETVWKVKNGDGPYHVQEIRDGVSVCVEETSCEFMPEELTHERPDSWEKWREDSELRPIDYCVMIGYPPSEEESTELIKNCDLVRRAKALAERGA